MRTTSIALAMGGSFLAAALAARLSAGEKPAPAAKAVSQEALVEPSGEITFGHVGDSRAYLLRGDRLEQLTDDHSLVAELVRRGELSARDAEVHPQRSVITRALGPENSVEVDTFRIPARGC